MAEEKLVQKNIRFPEALWERVEAATSKTYNASDFVRDAVREKLAKVDAEARIAQLERRVKDLEGRE
jgi:Arc/MetJ-type ribon-helix-helix transcriptional regulator